MSKLEWADEHKTGVAKGVDPEAIDLLKRYFGE